MRGGDLQNPSRIQGKGIEGVRDRILPVQEPRQSRDAPAAAHSCLKRVLSQQNLGKHWRGALCPCQKTASILQQPLGRAVTESGSGGARVWPAPATRCHQLLDQRGSDPGTRLCQPAHHSRGPLSHVPPTEPEKTGTFPSKTACCLSLVPFRCLWLTPLGLQSLSLFCRLTEKENPTQL